MGLKIGSLNKVRHGNSSGLSEQILSAILRGAEGLVAGRSWFDNVSALLEEVGKATGVSRVWMFQTLELQDDYVIQDYVFEWASQKKYAQIDLPHLNHFRTEINEPEYGALIESRINGEYQDVSVNHLPDSTIKEFLAKQNILSMLTIPIMVDNQWWGTLGLDDCERDIEWSPADITLLRTASYFISSAIIRDNLNARKHQLELLKENKVCSSWELDFRRGILRCTSEIVSNYSGAVANLYFTQRAWLKRIHPEHRKNFFKMAKRFLAQPNQQLRYDLRVQRNNGDYCWIEINAHNSEQSRTQDNIVAGIFWDITERKQEEERLILDAATDPLTGLVNRRKIISLLESHQANFESEMRHFSLAILDIDHFKQINDTYGHDVGDQVLIHFSELCRSFLRKNDYIGRIGGEEFALLLADTQAQEAQQICQRLCEMVNETVCTVENLTIQYSISIGVTTVKGKDVNIQQLFKVADKAMYEAKQSGRNSVVSAG